MTTLLHLDLDAFFASVEQLKNPALRGRPVIVGNGVIASCSYDARRSGLRAGMPIRQALRLCPAAVVLDGDQSTYRCFADAVWEVARRFLPAMETYLDEAVGDLTGTGGLYGHPLKVGRALREAVRREVGLSITVGIAANRMVAKMAGKSVKPDGLAFVPWGQEAGFIAARPVEDLPGIGPATAPLLHDMNVHTIADLRAIPLETLAALFGRNGVHFHERCRGRDTRPLHEREIPRSISRETRLHAPSTDDAELLAYLQYLAERAMRAVRGLGLAARAVRVRIGYEDGPHVESVHSLPEATALDEDVLPAARELFAKLRDRRVAVVRVGAALERLVLPDPQAGLFDDPTRARLERLHAALDALRDKFGHAAVVAGDSIALVGRLRQEPQGFVLRTPSLTK